MFWLVALKAFWSLCVILVSAAARMVKVGEQYTQPPRQIVAARTTAAVKWSYVLCFPSEVCVLALPLPLKSCSTAASSQAGLWVRVRYGPFVEDLQIARNKFFAKTRHEHCICTSYTQRPSFNLTCKSVRSSAAIQVWARAQIGASIFLNLLIHTLMAVGCMSYSFVSQKYIQTQRGHTHTHSVWNTVSLKHRNFTNTSSYKPTRRSLGEIRSRWETWFHEVVMKPKTCLASFSSTIFGITPRCVCTFFLVERLNFTNSLFFLNFSSSFNYFGFSDTPLHVMVFPFMTLDGLSLWAAVS